MERTFISEFWGRQTARSKFISIATPYARDDLNYRLINRGIQGFKFGVLNDDGTPRWPSRWPKDRIDKVRRGMPAREAARQLDCELVSDQSSMFLDAWIRGAVERGAEHTLMTRCPEGWGLNSRGLTIAIGCDPAASTKPTADLCALAVVAKHPGGVFELLSLESGRWGAPAAVARIVSLVHRFNPRTIVVESNGMQISWVQELRHRGLNVTEQGLAEKALAVVDRLATSADDKLALDAAKAGLAHLARTSAAAPPDPPPEEEVTAEQSIKELVAALPTVKIVLAEARVSPAVVDELRLSLSKALADLEPGPLPN